MWKISTLRGAQHLFCGAREVAFAGADASATLHNFSKDLLEVLSNPSQRFGRECSPVAGAISAVTYLITDDRRRFIISQFRQAVSLAMYIFDAGPAAKIQESAERKRALPLTVGHVRILCRPYGTPFCAASLPSTDVLG
jgi:hypothetical protein